MIDGWLCIKLVCRLTLSLYHTSRISNGHPSHLLQHGPLVGLPIPLPRIEAFLGLDAERLVPLLDDVGDFLGGQVAGLLLDGAAALGEELLVVRADVDEGVDGVAVAVAEAVVLLELGEGLARLDDLVEEVVVGGRGGEEGLARGEGEGDEVDDVVEEGLDVGEVLEVGGILREEADEREEGAEELGPVVF